jgi:hypothetical protein
MPRPTLRGAFATVAAAAVLVGGADLAAYAATGNALILGHSNSAGTTTSLKNTGRGPALSLNNIKSAPPLVVNSSKMVKHLNANMVGGKTAGQLNPAALTWRIGHSGSVVDNGTSQLFSTTLPKGTWRISISAFATEDGVDTTSDSWQCLAVDYHKLLDNPSDPDVSGYWAADGHSWDDFEAALVDVTTNDIKLTHARKMLYGCLYSGTTGTITFAQPPTFSFTPVSVKSMKQGSVVALPKTAIRQLRSGR